MVWIGRIRSKSVDWLHSAFGNSQIKIWNCSHFREVGEGIEPYLDWFSKTSFRTNPPISPKKEPKQTTCAPTNLISDQLSILILRLLPWCSQQCSEHHRLKRMDLLGGRSPLWVMGHESWVMICHGSWLFFVYLFFEFLDYGCKYLEDTSHIVIQRVEGFICEITIGMK